MLQLRKSIQKAERGFNRKSLYASAQLKNIYKSVKDVIEEQFNVTLTPDQKGKRFLCPSCSWSLISLAKYRDKSSEAAQKLRTLSSTSGYLVKKINVRSPVCTPRKIKRQRLVSSQKVQSYLFKSPKTIQTIEFFGFLKKK